MLHADQNVACRFRLCIIIHYCIFKSVHIASYCSRILYLGFLIAYFVAKQILQKKKMHKKWQNICDSLKVISSYNMKITIKGCTSFMSIIFYIASPSLAKMCEFRCCFTSIKAIGETAILLLLVNKAKKNLRAPFACAKLSLPLTLNICIQYTANTWSKVSLQVPSAASAGKLCQNSH